MDLRACLNTVYAALAEGRDEAELRQLDEQLEEAPRPQSKQKKQQLQGLMTAMRMQGR